MGGGGVLSSPLPCFIRAASGEPWHLLTGQSVLPRIISNKGINISNNKYLSSLSPPPLSVYESVGRCGEGDVRVRWQRKIRERRSKGRSFLGSWVNTMREMRRLRGHICASTELTRHWFSDHTASLYKSLSVLVAPQDPGMARGWRGGVSSYCWRTHSQPDSRSHREDPRAAEHLAPVTIY